MSEYQVTARKWRPQNFDQVIGQEHVTTALANAITSGRIPHAYLFSGPRGVGKTSTARILAKVLNCAESPNVCGRCAACTEIASGQALDVQEIDGASNRGIEHIRNIKENASYAPLSMKYKVFIIDEVHMLTKEASNALLKVLEEPPTHLIFMLATTEANKVLPTIRSRCQHYLLKRIPLSIITSRLKEIADSEGFSYEMPALEEIARAGDGSMRDSQTIFDQAALYAQNNLTLQAVREVLGLPEDYYFEAIFEAFGDQDAVKVLETLSAYLGEAGDGMSFGENLVKYVRKGLLSQKLPQSHELMECSVVQYEKIKALFSGYQPSECFKLMNLSLELCETLRHETAERFWIEGALFKMMDVKNRLSPAELRQEFQRVLAGGSPRSAVQPNPRESAPPPPKAEQSGELEPPKIKEVPPAALPPHAAQEDTPMAAAIKNLFE